MGELGSALMQINHDSSHKVSPLFMIIWRIPMSMRSVLLLTALCLSPVPALAGVSGAPGNLITLAQADARHDGSQQWVRLGCRVVNFSVGLEVINVGANQGGFTAIQLRASGNDVELLDLKVIYTNGDPDYIPVGSVLHAGFEIGPLSLKGR